jgi:hypothetical protein
MRDHKKATISNAITGILAIGTLAVAGPVQAGPKGPTAWETCAGIA